IRPSPEQPIALFDDFKNPFNIVHSTKPTLSQKKIHNALPNLNYLKEQPNVEGATPQLRAQIFYLSGSMELGGNLIGVDIMEEVRLSNLGDNIVEGNPEALKNNESGIILGAGLAERMSLCLGARVQITTVTGNIFHLKIVGIYQSGIAEVDNVQSFTNLKTLQRILGEVENYVTDINVKLLDIAQAGSMAERMEKQFDVKAMGINEANAQFESGSNIRNLITYAVSITLLIVAGFGIYNILNMLIYEKMKDIAILKATGFSGTDVQLIFMGQAVIIGVAGGVLGLLTGFVLSKIIDRTPFRSEEHTSE